MQFPSVVCLFSEVQNYKRGRIGSAHCRGFSLDSIQIKRNWAALKAWAPGMNLLFHWTPGAFVTQGTYHFKKFKKQKNIWRGCVIF